MHCQQCTLVCRANTCAARLCVHKPTAHRHTSNFPVHLEEELKRDGSPDLGVLLDGDVLLCLDRL